MSDSGGAPKRKRGRPRGARNKKTIVRAVALEKQAVLIGDQVVVMNTVQYVLHALRVLMMKGNLPALHALESLAVRLGASEGHGVLIAPAEIAEAAWIAHEEAKNNERKPPPRRDPDEEC